MDDLHILDDENMDDVESNPTPTPTPTPTSIPTPSTSPSPSNTCLRMPVKRARTNYVPRPASNDTNRIGSEIWDHYTKILGPPIRAKCNYCARDYAAESKGSGTSSMWKHIYSCAVFARLLEQQHTNQRTLNEFSAKDGDGSSVMVCQKNKTFNIEFLRESLAKFLMIDEKSFRTVEGRGFLQFVRALEPRFVVPSRTTAARDCFKVFVKEKKLMRKLLKGHRLSLTTDCWTSNQNLSYMALTGHFIDESWVIQKRILNFSLVDDHKGDTIGKVVECCLMEWGLDKVLTITVDNASANDKAIDYLKLCNWSDVVLKNQYLHVRCSAHIVNLIVKDGLKEQSDSILRIRNAVRYVRSSTQRLKKFQECVAYERIDCKKGVSLDVETRWNSTFMMLEAATKYRKAFERLRREDVGYVLYFSGAILGPPSNDDWAKADAFVKFLELFYEATLVFSGSEYVTTSMFFSQLVEIYLTIKIYEDDDDIVLSSMAKNMKAKFEKYWLESELGNNLLVLGVIFDPRLKFKQVEFCFEQMYSNDLGGSATSTVSAKAKYLSGKIRNELDVLVEFYSEKYGSKDAVESTISSSSQPSKSNVQLKELLKSRFKQKLQNEQSVETKSELTRYLHEACEEDEKLDILQWWKINSFKYPVLSMIAKEVLAIPVSTVASEQSFSTGGRVLNEFRSSLNPKTVEMLVCGQNWLRAEHKPISLREALDDIEKYEEIAEHELSATSGAGSN